MPRLEVRFGSEAVLAVGPGVRSVTRSMRRRRSCGTRHCAGTGCSAGGACLARCNSLAPFAARCGSAEGRLKGRDFLLEAQATGVVAGAVVGGPLGAVVGGVA